MIVEQRGGERQPPTHILKGVVAHDVELLQRVAPGRRLALLLGDDRVEPLVEGLNVAQAAPDRGQDVLLTVLTAQHGVVAPQARQTQGLEQSQQQRQQGRTAHYRERDRQLFEREAGHGEASYTGHMRPEQVKELLEAVRAGRLGVDDALEELRTPPVADLGFARVDLHRELRQGLPEAIYAEHKRPEEIVAIAARMLAEPGTPVLATRVTPAGAAALLAAFPDAVHHERARLVVLRAAKTRLGSVAVVAAGTSDLPVAEEAVHTAAALGADTGLVVDVGVAGVHRLFQERARLAAAGVVIVVAGMEGALASLIGGLIAAPVIAVPTSVGYGASFEGLAALLGMLSSCAAGITVTNIDNGFGAAVAAAKILRAVGRLG